MSINNDLKRAAEAVLAMGYPWEHTVRDGRLGKTSTEYARLAHPLSVRALIVESDHLAMCARQWEEAAMQWGAERDQLRAEVSGLRTGYEAYEQVNAELKAEVERSEQHRNDQQDSIVALRIELASLRKDADRYRWLLQNWFTMSSEYMGGVSFQTGRSRWSDLPDEAVSEAIDAALGQGEQS